MTDSPPKKQPTTPLPPKISGENRTSESQKKDLLSQMSGMNLLVQETLSLTQSSEISGTGTTKEEIIVIDLRTREAFLFSNLRSISLVEILWRTSLKHFLQKLLDKVFSLV